MIGASSVEIMEKKFTEQILLFSFQNLKPTKATSAKTVILLTLLEV